jgi:tRNA (guanine37-N1)-methyltransferase
MKFTVVTLLPELVEGAFVAGVVGRARDAGVISVSTVNPRDFTTDKHRTVDDTPYGGGPGMVMKAEPLLAAIAVAVGDRGHRIALTPSGSPLNQAKVRSLADHPHLVLICGRYEGIDQRVLDWAVDEEISIGDYVLSGGELGALVVIDAVSRLIPGVLGELASTDDESFSDGLLEYPQYTRPHILSVPESIQAPVPAILSSGNHAAIADWRKQQSMIRTATRRPDLWRGFVPSARERTLLAGLPQLGLAQRTYVALVHYPVVDRTGAVVTTALTNLDLHDIARSTATYGLAGYFVITPVTSQRDKAVHIASMWKEQQAASDRVQALEKILLAASVEEAIAAIELRHGLAAWVVATSASDASFPAVPRCDAHDLGRTGVADERPLLLLFGTGWGLAPELGSLIEHVLTPIFGPTNWNHLSVRSAVAITLDRVYGRDGVGGKT